MILNKITTGFVIQSFDTETGKYFLQEFVAGDEKWENPDDVDESVDCEPTEEFPIILNQPTDNEFMEGEQVLVKPSGKSDDLVEKEFVGVVAGKKDEWIVVLDATGEDFDCEPTQLVKVL